MVESKWRRTAKNLAICLAAAAMLLAAVLLAALAPMRAALAAGGPVNPPPGRAAVETPAAVEATHVPLSTLLALVPDNASSRAWLSYSDMIAWHEATGVPRVASYAAIEALAEADRSAWLYTRSEQTAPPPVLGLNEIATGTMRPALGFDFFDVAQALESGQAPENVVWVNLHVAPEAIATALTATGYAQSDEAGAVLYSRGDDYATDFSAETLAGQMGSLNRIALLDSDNAGSQVLIARATAPITQSLATATGDSRSLADDRTYRTLAGALEYEGLIPGALVGLVVQDGMQPMQTVLQDNQIDTALLDRYARDPLPPYRLSAYATTRDGDDTYLTVLLAMDGTSDSSDAAAILGDRLSDYTSALTGEPLSDQWEVVTTGSYESEARLAYVVLKLIPESDLAWTELLARRDLLFLYAR